MKNLKKNLQVVVEERRKDVEDGMSEEGETQVAEVEER